MEGDTPFEANQINRNVDGQALNSRNALLRCCLRSAYVLYLTWFKSELGYLQLRNTKQLRREYT